MTRDTDARSTAALSIGLEPRSQIARWSPSARRSPRVLAGRRPARARPRAHSRRSARSPRAARTPRAGRTRARRRRPRAPACPPARRRTARADGCAAAPSRPVRSASSSASRPLRTAVVPSPRERARTVEPGRDGRTVAPSRSIIVALVTAVEPALLQRQSYIDGKWVGADSGETFPVVDPATGETVAEVPRMGAGETRRALAAAERALPAWKARPAKERARILRRLADLMLEREEDLARLMVLEQG